jgi:tRNA dimethylallyltransferase
MTRLVAVVGSTATGKSALGLAIARAFDGEIVACDSTAVYRGLDIGTDKVPVEAQAAVPHHLVDVVAPTDVYSAARYAADAAAAIGGISARGRLPILVGGTGFYYRALVRGLFPGPARDDGLRARLERAADRRGVEWLHRWLERVDPASARRIQPRDRKRLVRALEVYRLTGRPLTAHFAETASLIADYDVVTIGLRLPRPALEARVRRRVDEQFARGIRAEVDALIASGVPETAHAFSGLVYRQVIEWRRGARDEAATRELIVRENLRYARRQLLWFRHEPGVQWIEGAGESEAVRAEALSIVAGVLAGEKGSRAPRRAEAPDRQTPGA